MHSVDESNINPFLVEEADWVKDDWLMLLFFAGILETDDARVLSLVLVEIVSLLVECWEEMISLKSSLNIEASLLIDEFSKFQRELFGLTTVWETLSGRMLLSLGISFWLLKKAEIWRLWLIKDEDIVQKFGPCEFLMVSKDDWYFFAWLITLLKFVACY